MTRRPPPPRRSPLLRPLLGCSILLTSAAGALLARGHVDLAILVGVFAAATAFLVIDQLVKEPVQ